MRGRRLFASLGVGCLLAACAPAKAQDPERMPQRIGPLVPVARAIDSTHRIVCYVFPDGSGDCEKF